MAAGAVVAMGGGTGDRRAAVRGDGHRNRNGPDEESERALAETQEKGRQMRGSNIAPCPTTREPSRSSND
jgi:hypothetical protein